MGLSVKQLLLQIY